MPFKEDLQTSVAELVYCDPLRMPSEILTPTADSVYPAPLITELRQHMTRLRSVPAPPRLPGYIGTNEVEKGTRVFLRQDTKRRALEPPTTERGNTETTGARQAHHRIRWGQAGLHPQWD
jgi:hypothetical protein